MVEEDEEEEEANEDLELQEECGDQIERVLKQRAMSVNLHPEIEDSCRDFLVQNCVGNAGNGEELKCLQVGLTGCAFIWHLSCGLSLVVTLVVYCYTGELR